MQIFNGIIYHLRTFNVNNLSFFLSLSLEYLRLAISINVARVRERERKSFVSLLRFNAFQFYGQSYRDPKRSGSFVKSENQLREILPEKVASETFLRGLFLRITIRVRVLQTSSVTELFVENKSTDSHQPFVSFGENAFLH